jgi:predicted dehydrogenase
MTRLAIIGFGKIAAEHLRAFNSIGATIVASANRSPEGRRMAEQAGIKKTYADYGEMLDEECVDGVICCVTETQMHAVGSSLMTRKIPLLLEKPPGTSLQDVHDLYRLSQEHDTKVMVGLNRRHYSVLQQAIKEAGGVHQIKAVHVEWSERLDLFERRGFGPQEIEQMVFGYSLHGIDLLTYLAGGLEEASVFGRSLGEPYRWQMAVQGVSSRGVLSTFHSSWDSPVRWRVSFETPSKHFMFAPLESCVVSEYGAMDKTNKRQWLTRDLSPDADDVAFKPGILKQAKCFMNLIEGGDQSAYGLQSTLEAMSLADRLTQACLSETSPT